MGYYSDVYFATTKRGFDFLLKRKYCERNFFLMQTELYNAKDNCVLVCWDMIKWDDTDP